MAGADREQHINLKDGRLTIVHYRAGLGVLRLQGGVTDRGLAWPACLGVLILSVSDLSRVSDSLARVDGEGGLLYHWLLRYVIKCCLAPSVHN